MTTGVFLHIIVLMFFTYPREYYLSFERYKVKKGGAAYHENDISAEEEIQIQGSRIPGKNENSKW